MSFTPLLRPTLRLPFGEHPVLDASVAGIRVLYTSAARPQTGTVLSGRMEWPHGEPPLPIRGTIVRVEPGAIAVALESGAIPLGYLP